MNTVTFPKVFGSQAGLFAFATLKLERGYSCQWRRSFKIGLVCIIKLGHGTFCDMVVPTREDSLKGFRTDHIASLHQLTSVIEAFGGHSSLGPAKDPSSS